MGPPTNNPAITKVGVPAGPEDIVVDRLGGRNRLIVSCRSLRKCYGRQGSLVTLDLNKRNPEYKRLLCKWRGVALQPHGLALSGDRLYVLNHQPKECWEVLVFRLDDSGALVEGRSLGGSPLKGAEGSNGNDLTVPRNGNLVMTMPSLLRNSKSRILHYPGAGDVWSVLDRNPPGRYPNGAWADRNAVLVSSAGGVHRYENGGSPREVVPKAGAGDNFGEIEGKPREILLTSHQSQLRYGLNSIFPCWRSPSHLTRIHLDSGESNRVVLKDGSQYPINCASVAVVASGNLWLGQVFEPYLLKVPVDLVEGLQP